MKRYVKEFANDLLKYANKEEKSKIENTVKLCERGLITDREAVKLLIENYYK